MKHAHDNGLIASRRDGKLTHSDVSLMRELLSVGMTGVMAAKLFGVSKDMVSKIKLGRRWQEATA